MNQPGGENQAIPARLEAGERMDRGEGRRLFQSASLTELGRLAHALRLRRTAPDTVTYVLDRNINYTNICESQCRFCAFYRTQDHPDAYVLTFPEIGAKVAELQAVGGRQILLQGGLNPDLRLEWFESLLRFLKSEYGIYIHGFSAPEILFLAELEGLSAGAVLERLRTAGLDSMPGGGAEILTNAVRARISPRKYTADQWMDTHAQAHRLGLRTSATMMFGHVETLDDVIEHLDRIRTLQDETAGFTAFIAWPFQSGATALGAETGPGPQGGVSYLRMVTLARLYLDNFSNIQASWVTQGPEIGQIALRFGANDFGSTMMEENVVRSAGCAHSVTEERMRALIREAGYTPRRRGFIY